MKRALCLLALVGLWGGSALAADFVFATEDLETRRFRDDETMMNGNVEASVRLQVVYELDEWIRVRLPGGKFGWIPADKVTDETPEGTGQEGAASGDGTGGLKFEFKPPTATQRAILGGQLRRDAGSNGK